MADHTPRESKDSVIAAGWKVEGSDAGAHVSTASGDTTALEGPALTHAHGAESNHAASDHSALAVTSDESMAPTPSGDADHREWADAPERQQLGSAALVLLGIFGGIALVYAWIWLSWAQFYVSAAAEQLIATHGVVGSVVQKFLILIVPLAPLLWYLSVALLLRRAKTWKLALWLVVGAIVLVPLPYVLGGA